MALNPRIKAFAERVLPKSVLAWLDPVQALIESEVKWAADELVEGQVVLDAGAGEARHRIQGAGATQHSSPGRARVGSEPSPLFRGPSG